MKYSIRQILKEPKLQSKIFPYSKLDYQTINPTNNKLINKYSFDSIEDIKNKIIKANNSYLYLRHESNLENQLFKINNLSNVFKKHKNKIANLITLEMGKPISESLQEVDRVVSLIQYYIEYSPEFFYSSSNNNNSNKTLNKKLPDIPNIPNINSYYLHEPLGVIMNITPWNLPLAMPMKSIIPALIARNACILKPAPNVPKTSLIIEECFIEAGFNNNEFQLTFASNDNLDYIMSDDKINYIVFTGSTAAGREVGKIAGKNIKRCLLELGGSDPMLILDDVDIESTVDKAIEARLRTNGQTCTSSKRFIILDKNNNYERFKECLSTKIDLNNINSKIRMGNPLDDKTTLGPIARFDLMIKLYNQIESNVDLTNNKYNNILDLDSIEYNINSGNYFKPVIIENIKNNSLAYKEELFGPVFSLYKANSEEEMINTANDTEYGLGACIMSKDINKVNKIISRINNGMCFVNTPFIANPRLPFGGCKNSGYGRANNKFIFNELTNIKTVTVDNNNIL